MAYSRLRFLPTFIVILLTFPTASVPADMSQALNASEDWEEGRWVVSYIGKSFVIASINGQITHGDRLRLRLDFGECDHVSLITSVYTMKGNENILDMDEKEIPIEFDEKEFVGTMLQPRKFLMGHSFLLYLGSSSVAGMKTYFAGSTSTTLQLLDGDDTKISDYVDVDRNEWSLNGVDEALEKAQATCRAGKKLKL